MKLHYVLIVLYGDKRSDWMLLICLQIVGDFYHFKHRKVAKRSTVASESNQRGLASEAQVTERNSFLYKNTNAQRETRWTLPHHID